MSMISLIIPEIIFSMLKQTKKVTGKMKQECAHTPIAEYIGLRPKL